MSIIFVPLFLDNLCPYFKETYEFSKSCDPGSYRDVSNFLEAKEEYKVHSFI